MEIVHEDAMTPHRIYSIVTLLIQYNALKRRELLDLLQPKIILGDQEQGERNEKQDAATRNLRAARFCGLVIEEDNRDKTTRLDVEQSLVSTFESFRNHMQVTLLGITKDGKDQFLLNQFTGWYAVQDEAVFALSRTGIETDFNEQLYPNSPQRAFRERSNWNAWRTWAEFLGFGWSMQLGSRRDAQFIPDATLRIQPLLPQLLPRRNTDFQMATFMEQLGKACPELDGGVLFERCWQASRGNERRGNRLSLMLSTGLRVLHARGEIELLQRKDASENWSLFPSQSHINSVTHIRRKAAE